MRTWHRSVRKPGDISGLSYVEYVWSAGWCILQGGLYDQSGLRVVAEEDRLLLVKLGEFGHVLSTPRYRRTHPAEEVIHLSHSRMPSFASSLVT